MGDHDPYRPGRERLEQSVLEGPGHTDVALRRAAASGRDLPPALAPYVDKVRRHAHRVTDEDAARLHQAGYTDDQLFEITASAALGAARERLLAALSALEEADAPAKA